MVTLFLLALDIWLSRSEVTSALHAANASRFVNCDNADGLNYTLSETNLAPYHRYIATKTNLRTLIYNGDTGLLQIGMEKLVMHL